MYQNANYGGTSIFFSGSGCANLTDFGFNDTLSSFGSSGVSRALWWDTNDSGYYYLYGPSPRVTTTNYIGNTWNDQASSIEMDGPHSSGC